MGVTNFPNGVNIGDSAGATSLWQLGGTTVDVTAGQLNAIAADSLSATELAYLDTVVAGTATASKALVLGPLKDIDSIDFQSATAPYKIAGSAVNTSAAELNKLDAVTAGTVTASKAVVVGAFKDIDTLDFQATSGLKIAGVAVTSSAAELNYIDTSVPGTAVASKALVLGAAKDVDILDFAGAGGTAFKIAGTAVTTSAAELNFVDTVVAGTATASKALVLGPVKDIDTLDFASAGGFKIAGVALTASMADLNKSAGMLGAKALSYDSATVMVAASGSTAITGAGTVASGMANVQNVVASLANVGTAAGEANVVFANPSLGGGSVIFSLFDGGGTVATSAGTVNWVAFGTAA